MDHDILDAFASWIVCEFRANGGRVEAPFNYANLILLTTRTAGGGRMRPVPVICCPDPNGIMVAAVDRPGQGYPIWYLNLVTDPWAMVETGKSTFQACAEISSADAPSPPTTLHEGRAGHDGLR